MLPCKREITEPAWRSRVVVSADDRAGHTGTSLSTNGAYRLAYRPDVDGLRAIAVIAVLGYHLQISWVPGGFVGVDIFFVISGYLIGALILKEARAGSFSLVSFYARRVRRIAPAFGVMVSTVLVVSYFKLLPSEYVRFAWSAFYSALSVSNIYFYYHAGYFDAPASTQPLLHTWSLGVEEQFYLFFPVLVVIVFKCARNRLNASIALILLCSFALSVYETLVAPRSAFYLAPARVWELLLGVLLVNQSWTAKLPSFARHLGATAGLAMIGFAITTFTYETPFPGAAALIPCLGAALVIAAGQSGGSLVGSALSLRPVVFVGLISYSLYLWHWPILFFVRFDSLVLTTRSRVAVILFSLVAATLSWQFVEKPFRKRFRSLPDARVIFGGLTGLVSLATIALLVITGDGFPARFSPTARAFAQYLGEGQAHFREGECFIVGPYTFADFDRAKCLGTQSGRKNYLLLGDSHAAQLWYGLSAALPDVNILQATAAGCKPRLRGEPRTDVSCALMMGFVFSEFLRGNHVDRLLIAGRWVESDLTSLEKVLAWAKARDIPVTLFGPMVEYDFALPRLLAEAAQMNDPKIVTDNRTPNDSKLDNQLRAVAVTYGARYISFYHLLCISSRCLDLTPEGSPLEFDTDHLTREGSLLVARELINTGQLN